MNKFLFFIKLRCGLGDYVCSTSLISELKKMFPNKKIILITGNKIVFENNLDIFKIIYIKERIFQVIYSYVFLFLSKIFKNNIYICFYKKDKYKTHEEEIRVGSQDNYLKLISRHWNLPINYKNIKNKIVFSNEEIEMYGKKYNFLPKNYILIHSQGKISYTPNKEIGYDFFQKIINMFENLNWIQIGDEKDKKLNKCIDLTGKTNIRELFYLVSKSQFIVCQEGAYNHIANAFSIPAVTIFTGFSPKKIYSYKNTIAIQSENLPECSPCMLIKKECPYNMKCINGNKEEIILQIYNQISRFY